MFRIAILLSALCALAACAVPTTQVDDPKRDLGDFELGHNIVVAPDIVKGPLSRDASAEQWKSAVKAAIDARLGRYEGDRLVHLGVNVGGYVLAQPGVPLLVSPKSVLAITVTAWDDKAGGKFNDEPKEIIVLESVSGGTLVGTGYTLSAEEQMANLSYNVAKQIEDWLYDNRVCLTDNATAEQLAKCWKDNKDERLAQARRENLGE